MDGKHHVPATLPQEGPGTHSTGGWVGLRTGLDSTESLTPPGFNLQTIQPTASPYTDCNTPRIV
jgi:hypothetical protein